MWTIAIVKAESGTTEPLFYYNYSDDVWQRDLNSRAVFMDEIRCNETYKRLDILGAYKLPVQTR